MNEGRESLLYTFMYRYINISRLAIYCRSFYFEIPWEFFLPTLIFSLKYKGIKIYLLYLKTLFNTKVY